MHAALAAPLPSASLLTVARANYTGVFGTQSIEAFPDSGNGVFYRNSRVQFSQLKQGVGKTVFVGERSSRTGIATWVGVIPGADQAMVRILGTTERMPNDVLDDDASFSSEHASGVNFSVGDHSVKLVTDEIDAHVFRAMCTRDGTVPGDILGGNLTTAQTAVAAKPRRDVLRRSILKTPEPLRWDVSFNQFETTLRRLLSQSLARTRRSNGVMGAT